jgi:hypothetical protein
MLAVVRNILYQIAVEPCSKLKLNSRMNYEIELKPGSHETLATQHDGYIGLPHNP